MLKCILRLALMILLILMTLNILIPSEYVALSMIVILTQHDDRFFQCNYFCNTGDELFYMFFEMSKPPKTN